MLVVVDGGAGVDVGAGGIDVGKPVGSVPDQKDMRLLKPGFEAGQSSLSRWVCLWTWFDPVQRWSS